MNLFGSEKQAYPGSRESMFLCDPAEVAIIGVDTSPDVLIELCDTDRNVQPLPEEFVASIMAYGVQKPVKVRKVVRKETGESWIAVVDGRQRVRGLREANRRLASLKQPPMQLPIVPEKGRSLTAADLALRMVACNVTVPETTMSKAKKADMLLTRGVAKAQVALAMGVTEKTIDNWRALLSTGEDVQEAVAKGEMTATAAIAVAKATPDEQSRAAQAARTAPKKRRSALARALYVWERTDTFSPNKLRKLVGWIAGKVGDDEVKSLVSFDELDGTEE